MSARVRFCIVVLLLAGAAWGQEPRAGGPGRSAIELLVNGPVYENNLPVDLGSPLEPRRAGRVGGRFLYVVDLYPGRSYTLGLIVPGPTRQLAVTFFDRVPLAPQASGVRLPTRPVVRTRGRAERYLWRFSISPRSAGRRLYVLVELAPLGDHFPRRPHRIFVASPAIEPSLSIGRGQTFLEGPRRFLLGGAQASEPDPLVNSSPPDLPQEPFGDADTDARGSGPDDQRPVAEPALPAEDEP